LGRKDGDDVQSKAWAEYKRAREFSGPRLRAIIEVPAWGKRTEEDGPDRVRVPSAWRRGARAGGESGARRRRDAKGSGGEARRSNRRPSGEGRRDGPVLVF
jgi:hypothetical protein